MAGEAQAGVGTAVADLGALDGPVLVFGGPVSNLQATEAVLAAGRAHGIPPARTICTGDVAAYCADPAATVDLLRSSGVHVVLGNCEESLAADAAGCGCNFAAGSACDALAEAWYRHARQSLSAAARAWMGGLPRALRFELAGRGLLAVHGAPSRINRWIFPATPRREKAAELAAAMADGIIAGHAGIPFAEVVDDHLWLNAGSVGLPANDGTPRGWYAILAPRAGGELAVRLHALDYDHATAAARMRAAGMPEAYATALETGLWPGTEVLPPEDRAETGVPLPATRTLVWTDDDAETTLPSPEGDCGWR